MSTQILHFFMVLCATISDACSSFSERNNTVRDEVRVDVFKVLDCDTRIMVSSHGKTTKD